MVDRRIVLEEEQGARRERAFTELKEGEIIRGTVRSVMDFGVFVELLPGVDGLLHIVDMSYTRIAKASDVAKPGDEIDAKILKIDPISKKISLGLKQLQEDPGLGGSYVSCRRSSQRYDFTARGFWRFC